MDRLNYAFGINLPQQVSEKLAKSHLFPSVSAIRQLPDFLQDHFYADGFPKVYDPDVLYPAYAAMYLGYPIPQTHLSVSRKYSHCASLAAADWLLKILPDPYCDTRHLDGEKFTAQVNGKDYNFCFPVLTVTYRCKGSMTQAAVLPYPDSRENSEEWTEAVVPSYVEAQARFLLWCYRQSVALGRRVTCPNQVLAVCITGNAPGDNQTSSDIKVRTITGNASAEDALVKRICRAYDKARATGADPAAATNIRAQAPWYEQKEAERANALHIDNADLHEVLQKYMTARSTRKSLEDKSDAIKDEMDSIAYTLAAMTNTDSPRGTVRFDDKVFYVTHTPKRFRSASVNADLVAQYYPQYMDCVAQNSAARGRITIDTL